MKTVLLFRHGKSDWDADYEHDHERPVAKRGRKAARAMGRFLAAAGEVPQAIITSSALRAIETMEIARKAAKWKDIPVRVTQTLYEADPQDVLYEIRMAPDEADVVLLVGHEPGWSGTVRLLTGGEVRFPTAAVARIDLDVAQWTDVRPEAGHLIWLLPPRLLP